MGVPLYGRPAVWVKATGAIGTTMESEMLDILYEPTSDSISTGKVFAEAARLGIPIHTIKKETLEADLAKVSAYAVTKNHIRSHVNAGYVAMIPQRSVKVGDWYGQGWTVLHEASGGAGYMICGGLNNETTMINGGSLSKAVDNLFIGFLKLAQKAFAHGDHLIIQYSAIIGAVCHIISAMFCLAYGYFFLAGWFFAVAIMIAVMAAFLIRVLNSHASYIRIRRRKYAYA